MNAKSARRWVLLRYWKDDIDTCYYEYFASASFPRRNISWWLKMNLLPLRSINSIFPYAISCTKFAAFATKFTTISPFCQTMYIVKQLASVEDNIRESKLTLLTSKPGWISTTCNELDQPKLTWAVKEWWKPWTPEIPRQDTDTSMFINTITTLQRPPWGKKWSVWEGAVWRTRFIKKVLTVARKNTVKTRV